MKTILILGSGFTGEALFAIASGVKPSLTLFQSKRSGPFIHFDLSIPSSWENLPEVEGTFWLFPAAPFDMLKKFLDLKAGILGKIVVVGSTGHISTSKVDELVNERSALDTSVERVRGEEEIRTRGGVVVRASGIYGLSSSGVERNPLRWLASGRVRPSPKFLNAIHVDDLAQILWKAMRMAPPSSSYIASDNHPLRWSELAELWAKEFGVQAPPMSESVPQASLSKRPQASLSKRVDAQETLKNLQITLRYPNVIYGVRRIMAQTISKE
jgi:hypothetical protein